MPEGQGGGASDVARSWWRRQPDLPMTVLLLVLAVLNAGFGWWSVSLDDGGRVRLALTLLWTVLALWLASSLVVRLRRGERPRRRDGYGSWWNL